MELPKVNIAVAASAVVAIVSTVGGGIWYASSQASIIEGLTEQVETLTIENNATDRTNLIRDVEENTERIDEIIEYIIEVEEDGGDTIDEIYEEFEEVYETQEGFLLQFNQIVKLQARIKTLENTLEYLTRSPIHSDAR
jgi:Zn-dependent oligopeptidase